MIECRMNEKQVSPMRYLLFLFVFYECMWCFVQNRKNVFCPGSDANQAEKEFFVDTSHCAAYNKPTIWTFIRCILKRFLQMIEYIKGELIELTPAQAIVEAMGVGYCLNISLNTYAAIQGKSEIKLFVHEAIVTGGRDDSYTLYGFATKQERELYRLLITVSGVGANSARMILSAMAPTELCNVISAGDDKMLKTVKGIGAKTAQRIIVDLHDKIVSSGITQELPVGVNAVSSVNTGVKDEAVGALTMLGFAPAASVKAVVEILKTQPSLPVEQVVKLALQQIK